MDLYYIELSINELSPFLNNRVTLTILSWSGKMPFSINRLKIYLRVSKTDGNIYLKTSKDHMSSYPKLFFVFIVWRASFNSWFVMSFSSRDK